MTRTRSSSRSCPKRLLPEAQFRRGAGCEHCNNTGFSGRLPVTELLVADEPLREAVSKKMPTLRWRKLPSDKA